MINDWHWENQNLMSYSQHTLVHFQLFNLHLYIVSSNQSLSRRRNPPTLQTHRKTHSMYNKKKKHYYYMSPFTPPLSPVCLPLSFHLLTQSRFSTLSPCDNKTHTHATAGVRVCTEGGGVEERRFIIILYTCPPSTPSPSTLQSRQVVLWHLWLNVIERAIDELNHLKEPDIRADAAVTQKPAKVVSSKHASR